MDVYLGMMQLANNLKVAAILASTNSLRSLEIVERRLAYLRSVGEDVRNTVSWRDAVSERAQLGRAFAMYTWHLRAPVAD